MLEHERHQRIVSLANERGVVSVQELQSLLGASEATLRRDLAQLHKEQRIERVRGGAARKSEAVQEPLHPYRNCHHQSTKAALGKLAASLVDDDDSIMLDGGSTIFHMCPALRDVRCTVITNSFPIAGQLLQQENKRVIVPAGQIDRRRQSILNPFAHDDFAHYAATKVFMSVQGIGPEGATNDDSKVIRAELQMIERAQKVILVVDSSKFFVQGALRLCGYDQIDTIITDSKISHQARALLDDVAVNVLIAD